MKYKNRMKKQKWKNDNKEWTIKNEKNKKWKNKNEKWNMKI